MQKEKTSKSQLNAIRKYLSKQKKFSIWYESDEQKKLAEILKRRKLTAKAVFEKGLQVLKIRDLK